MLLLSGLLLPLTEYTSYVSIPLWKLELATCIRHAGVTPQFER